MADHMGGVEAFRERLALAPPPLTPQNYARQKITIEAKTPRQPEVWWRLSRSALFGVCRNTGVDPNQGRAWRPMREADAR